MELYKKCIWYFARIFTKSCDFKFGPQINQSIVLPTFHRARTEIYPPFSKSGWIDGVKYISNEKWISIWKVFRCNVYLNLKKFKENNLSVCSAISCYYWLSFTELYVCPVLFIMSINTAIFELDLQYLLCRLMTRTTARILGPWRWDRWVVPESR
jgi:hypothetical protein